MKGFARVIVVFLTLVALVVGFVGGTVVLDTFQPANSKASTVVNFEVKQGDVTATVAARLQSDGLIRNALLFRAWARYKKLDTGIEPGVYQLNPSMTMDAIIKKLQVGKPDEFYVNLAGGLRATQYPAYFQALPKFSEKDFLTMAKTGIEPDGTKLWTKYWFINPPTAGKTAYALEGYLYPAGYYFYTSATAQDVIERLLTQFGIALCPGPDNKPGAYMTDAKQCRAHAVTVGGKNIFDLMRAAYPDAKTDVSALSDALIISSFAIREINNLSDLPGVATVYHNRYLVSIGQMSGDTGLTFGSDPSVEYARDTLTPPTNGKWWAELKAPGRTIAPTNPYNTYNQPGMPPGPIANPDLTELEGGAAPAKSPNLYFVSDKCGKILYATNKTDFDTKLVPAMSTGSC